jgi:hypothetical protein
MTLIRIFLLLLFIPSASGGGEIAVRIPSPDAITTIKVSQPKGQSVRDITDRAKIARVLALVAKHNRGWNVSWFTFPTPSASASFTTNDKPSIFILWFGPDWVGARAVSNEKTKNLLWHAPPEVESEIRRLLAINP